MKLPLKKIKNLLFILLGMTILTFPRYYQVFKGILLLVLFTIGYYEKIVSHRIATKTYVFFWYLFYLFFAFTWSIYGIVKVNPGAPDAFRLEFVWLILLFLFTIICSIDKSTILKMIYISSFLSSFIGLYCIFETSFGSISILSWLPFEKLRNINGLIRTNLPNVAFMSFLLPILMFLKLPSQTLKRFFVITTIITTTLFVLLAGRRVIQVVVVTSYAILLFNNVKRFKVKSIIYSLVGITGILFLVLHFNSLYNFIDFKVYYNLYIEKLLNNYQQDPRFIQFIEFWKYTKENFLIGVGFGKGIPSVVRDIERPWHYELTYSVYLYQTGIIGFILFVSLFTSLFFKLRKYFNIGRAFSMGLLFYMIASGTNPYFTSGFDYKFPILVIMLYLANSFKYPKRPDAYAK